ncbi:MAG: hypothetical protein HY581_06795 [Nitrospirae bacterium]|nr:hypothetical protein [Nitrospirota bacterium]
MRTSPRSLLALSVACVIAAGCASSPRSEATVHESQRGSVYVSLDRVPDKSFQAAHPIKLPPDVIARALRGLYVLEETSAVQAVFATQVKPVRAFSDEQIQFLAPSVAAALAEAASDQRVEFRVVYPVPAGLLPEGKGAAVGSSRPYSPGPGLETTGGTLYAYGLSLHLTLTKYRHRPERPDTINMPNRRLPDPTGLAQREVLFLPAEALRPETHQQTGFLGEPDLKTFVIDYELLAKLPGAQPSAVSSPAAQPEKRTGASERTQPSSPADSRATKLAEPRAATAEELQSMKELIIKKDVELEAMKEELRALRRQLEQQAEPQQPNEKKKPAPRPQETAP